MGIVYKALHKATGRIDAVKIITPAVSGSENVIGRFLREVAILRRLKHPNIVEFREFGHDQGQLYLAMEYVSGTNVSSLRKRAGGRLPQFLAVEIACQTLAALAYAHDHGFIHRDIKPRNLLVTRRDGKVCVKVADFGLARMYQDSPMSGLSFTGEIAGTSGYIPPEQVTNFRSTDPAADQYAMGATLYHMLSGSKIYDFPPNLARQLLMILQEEPVPIRNRHSAIPEALANAVHLALAREPADRYPNVSEMIEALEPFRTPPEHSGLASPA
jgi:serine/threonine protein kinase